MRKISATVIPICAVDVADQKTFAAWIWKVKDFTQFDVNIIAYPRACLVKASWEDNTPILYVPLHPVLMLESLAANPDITKSQKTLALWRVTEEMDKVMANTGMYETYFITQDAHFAERAVAAGFEEITGHVLKRKFKIPELSAPLVWESSTSTPTEPTERSTSDKPSEP